jgi:hypothetical protein
MSYPGPIQLFHLPLSRPPNLAGQVTLRASQIEVLPLQMGWTHKNGVMDAVSEGSRKHIFPLI